MISYNSLNNKEKKLIQYIDKKDINNIKILLNQKIGKSLIDYCINDILKEIPLEFVKLKILELLLDVSRNYNFIYKDKPILFYFIEKRDYNSLEFLLKKGVNVNFQYMKKTLWDHYFFNKMEDFSILNLILEYGADINIMDRFNNTPLILSIKHRYVFSFDLILKNSLHLVNYQNKKGNSALHYACLYNFYYIFKILLRFNANTNLKNYKNKKPIDLTNNITMKKILNNCSKVDVNEIEENKLNYSYKNKKFEEEASFITSINSIHSNPINNDSESQGSFTSFKERIKLKIMKTKHKKSGSFDFELTEQKDNKKLSENINLVKYLDDSKQKTNKKKILLEKYNQLNSKLKYINSKYYGCLLKNKIFNLNYYRVLRFNFNNFNFLDNRFNQEVLYFNRYLDEFNNFQKINDWRLIKLIKNKIKEYSNIIEIEIFGSFNTNLNLPFSDIDICLKNLNEEKNGWLLNLEKLFIELGFKTKTILTANIPILKIESNEKYKFRKVDITIYNNFYQGNLCIELINYYLKNYTMLKSLVRIFKEILKNNNLNDPFYGGLSSYSIILLLISFFQYNEFINKVIYNESYIKTFCNFLIYFINFDFNIKYISPFKTRNFNHNPILLKNVSDNVFIIIDPLNVNNNVSKASYNIFNVKDIFKLIYFRMTQIDDKILNSSIVFDKVKNTRYKYKFEINRNYQINLQDYIFLKNIFLNKF